MTLFLQIAAFALGTCVAIRAIAALHGVADYWYMIDKAWPRVAASVLASGAMIAVIAWLLHAPYRAAFAWGLLAYLLFYLSLLPLARLFVSRRRTDRRID